MTGPSEKNEPRRPPKLKYGCVTDPGTPPRQVYAVYANSPAYYTVYWGDTTRTPGKPSEGEEHRYAKAGMYYISIVLDDNGGKVSASGWLRVRDTVWPNVSLAKGDDPRYTDLMYFSIDEPEGEAYESYYDVDWGDGTVHENVLKKPGRTDLWHGYMEKGDYPVRITDHAMRVTKWLTHTVTDPDFDPDFSLECDPSDPSGMTATLTVTKLSRPELELWVNWDDGQGAKKIPSEVGYTESHTWTDGDFWIVTMSHPTGNDLDRTQHVFEPCPQTREEGAA